MKILNNLFGVTIILALANCVLSTSSNSKQSDKDEFIPSLQIIDTKNQIKRGAEESVQTNQQQQATVTVHGNQAAVNTAPASNQYQSIYSNGYGQYFAAASPQIYYVRAPHSTHHGGIHYATNTVSNNGAVKYAIAGTVPQPQTAASIQYATLPSNTKVAYGSQPIYSSPYHIAAYTNNIQQPAAIPYGPAIAIPYTSGHTAQHVNGHYQPSHIIPIATHGSYHHGGGGGGGVAAAHVQQVPVAHSANAFSSYRSNDITPTTATGKIVSTIAPQISAPSGGAVYYASNSNQHAYQQPSYAYPAYQQHPAAVANAQKLIAVPSFSVTQYKPIVPSSPPPTATATTAVQTNDGNGATSFASFSQHLSQPSTIPPQTQQTSLAAVKLTQPHHHHTHHHQQQQPQQQFYATSAPAGYSPIRLAYAPIAATGLYSPAGIAAPQYHHGVNPNNGAIHYGVQPQQLFQPAVYQKLSYAPIAAPPPSAPSPAQHQKLIYSN